MKRGYQFPIIKPAPVVKYYIGLFLGIFYLFAKKTKWRRCLVETYNFLCFLYPLFLSFIFPYKIVS